MAAKRNTLRKEAEPAKPLPVAPGKAKADSLVYDKLRLGILASLAVNDSLGFTQLRDLLGATDGNLSVHARKLEEAGLIACEKGFEGRKPKSTYQLTSAGRKTLDRYLDHMEALLRATRS
ncbi:MAG TPA: transcriptional regulator [Candidatus Limnocylindrales bacterium]|nr:transcriptional regulator [Candidatus Limnocylindrales bacterium]